MSGKMTADGKEVEKHEALHKDDPSLDGMPTEVAANSRLKTTRDGIELFPQPSDDPRDPLNWSTGKKLTLYLLMCYGTFAGTSTAVANVLATSVQAKTWNVTPEEAAYSISAVLAGIVVGPVLLVPLVRVFGLMSCCFWSEVAVVATSIWSALSDGPDDYNSFVASRAIAGLFAGTVQVFSAGVIAHIFFLHQRGKAFAVYSTIYMVATVAGPTFSGFVIQYVPWPIAFWWTVAANGLSAVLFLFFGEDTTWDRDTSQHPSHRPLPSSWAARRVALFLPGTRTVPEGKGKSIAQSFAATARIGFSPVTILAGIYSLICFAWFIMAGVQVPILLQNPIEAGGYGFSPQSTAFFYFAAWIGAITGVIYGVLLNDRLPLWLQKRNAGIWHPEYRLQTCWVPGLFIGPIGAGLFGAAAQYHTHWFVLALGECFLVFGATASIPPSVNYVIETFKSHPQEVGTALNVWRIGFSISIQFFYAGWVMEVGVNWVWGTAALINIFGFSLIVLMLWKGPLLRSWSLLPDEAAMEEDQRRKALAVRGEDVELSA